MYPIFQDAVVSFLADNRCKNDELNDWTPIAALRKGEVRNITDEGKKSMFCMGKRFRKRFDDFIPDLLDSRTEVGFLTYDASKLLVS